MVEQTTKVRVVLAKAEVVDSVTASKLPKDYGVSTAQAMAVIDAVIAGCGANDIDHPQVMVPYFEGAAKTVKLPPDVGLKVYSAFYSLFEKVSSFHCQKFSLPL